MTTTNTNINATTIVGITTTMITKLFIIAIISPVSHQHMRTRRACKEEKQLQAVKSKSTKRKSYEKENFSILWKISNVTWHCILVIKYCEWAGLGSVAVSCERGQCYFCFRKKAKLDPSLFFVCFGKKVKLGPILFLERQEKQENASNSQYGGARLLQRILVTWCTSFSY